jgi:rod shape-determining protein MreB and related proteins
MRNERARGDIVGVAAGASNLDLVLRHATGLPISIADEPLTCVALGAGRVLEEMQTLKRSYTFRVHAQR